MVFSSLWSTIVSISRFISLYSSMSLSIPVLYSKYMFVNIYKSSIKSDQWEYQGWIILASFFMKNFCTFITSASVSSLYCLSSPICDIYISLGRISLQLMFMSSSILANFLQMSLLIFYSPFSEIYLLYSFVYFL